MTSEGSPLLVMTFCGKIPLFGPVVQRIELMRPKRLMAVRFCPGPPLGCHAELDSASINQCKSPKLFAFLFFAPLAIF